ncbi:hypothetical protein BDA99DRAFT_491474 [Phascolomyces articulosus]|uniref:EamA domain-containing protein n=1 Tax=Phascolomyces articulosus TaxID=60185 RepID=A0AAD5KBL5_9FUNG|nr:hypothetical protein BDA99DRAFT_491474 [Phascolomyces articulosus]
MKPSTTEEKLLYLLSNDDDNRRIMKYKQEDYNDDDSDSNITYVTVITYNDQSDYYNEQRPLLQKDYSATLVSYTNDHQHPHRDKKTKMIGLGWIVVSMVLFSLMGVFVKLGGPTFPSFEIILARSVVEIVLGVTACIYFESNPFGYPKVRLWLLLSGVVGALAIAASYYAITHLIISDAAAIMCLNIPCTTLLAAYFLGESFRIFDGISIILCLAGTMCVSKPEFLFGSSAANNENDGYNDSDDGSSHDAVTFFDRRFAVFIALLTAFLISSNYCIVRKVGKKVHFMVYSVYNGVFLFIMCVPVLFTFQSFVWPQGFTEYAILFLSGVCAFSGHCFLSKGLQMAPAGFVALINANSLPLGLLFGVFMFKEYPDTLSLLGAAIIGAATVMSALRNKVV